MVKSIVGSVRATVVSEARSAFRFLLRALPDSMAVRLTYWRLNAAWLRLARPQTFSEMVVSKLLSDDARPLSPFVDKAAVREIVRQRLGPSALVPLVGVYASPKDIDWRRLPRQVVVKATHASGLVSIVDDVSDVDHDDLNRLFESWLKSQYHRRFRERPYAYVTPRILIEEYIGSDDGPPADYKFYVFDGTVRLLQVITRRGRVVELANVTTDGRLVAASKGYPRPRTLPELPKQLPNLVAAAEKLALGFEFVRIDLYLVNGKVYFGEYTFYPGAGMTPFRPNEFEYEMAAVWREGRPIADHWLLEASDPRLLEALG